MTTSNRGPRRYRGLVFICTFLIAAILPCGAAIGAPDPGTVRLARGAESSFDSYTAAPSADQSAWMRNSYWRMRAYAPYFNSRLAWYPSAWAYQDAYAIYPGSPEETQHPDWILKDANGNKLWIQFGCSNGSCTQYAADIGNPAFRAWWIQNAQARLAAGYKGLFIDDVNMAQRVSNGNGTYTMPIDPRTGQPMNETQWQKYMADFMVQVRAALPGVEIVHNTIWTMGDASSDLQRQLNAADYTYIEHGVVDTGITGGTSKFGWQTLMSFIDRRNAAGHGVILDGYTEDPTWRLYSLASYFLISNGNDGFGNDAFDRPDNYWSGFNVAPRRGAQLALRQPERLAPGLRRRHRAGQRARQADAHGDHPGGLPGPQRRRPHVGHARRGAGCRAGEGRRPGARADPDLDARADPDDDRYVAHPGRHADPDAYAHGYADRDAGAGHHRDADADAHPGPLAQRQAQLRPGLQGPHGGRAESVPHQDDRERQQHPRPRPRQGRERRRGQDRRRQAARQALGERPPRQGLGQPLRRLRE